MSTVTVVSWYLLPRLSMRCCVVSNPLKEHRNTNVLTKCFTGMFGSMSSHGQAEVLSRHHDWCIHTVLYLQRGEQGAEQVGKHSRQPGYVCSYGLPLSQRARGRRLRRAGRACRQDRIGQDRTGQDRITTTRKISNFFKHMNRQGLGAYFNQQNRHFTTRLDLTQVRRKT